MNNNAVVLLSGGLDSTVALWDTLQRCRSVIALNIMYGQQHYVERFAARKVAAAARDFQHFQRYIELDVSDVWMPTDAPLIIGGLPVGRTIEEIAADESISSAYVPGRNLVLLSVAAVYLDYFGFDEIVVGFNADDYAGFPDCRPEFLEKMASAIHLGTRAESVTINAPLVKMSKAEIVRRGTELDAPLMSTWSCYTPQEVPSDVPVDDEDHQLHNYVHCGECDACVIRENAFIEAGVWNPTEYLGGGG